MLDNPDVNDTSTTPSNTLYSSYPSPSSPLIEINSPRTSLDFTSSLVDFDSSAFSEQVDIMSSGSTSPSESNFTTMPSKINHKRHSSTRKQSLTDKDKNDNYEMRIAAGIEIVKSGTASIRAAAKQVQVSHETLRRRYQGASSRQEFHTQLMALSPAEEQLIEDLVLTFHSCSNMLTSSFLCSLVNDYRRLNTAAGAAVPKDLGISWTAGFRRRHKAVSEMMSKCMSKDKSDFFTKSAVEQWYSDIADSCTNFNIYPENMYNVVELGYYTESRSNALTCSKRNGTPKSNTFGDARLSSLEAICGDGTSLQPMIIVKGNSNSNLVSEATDDYGALTSTPDGRANSISFYDWFEYVFEPATAAKAGSGYRAVFVEANPLLFSAQVLQFALDHRIIFHLFPQQSSYIFQPFESHILASFCRNIHSISQSSTNIVYEDGKMDWDNCFSALQSARQMSMSPQVVANAWQSTGIIPVNSSQVMPSTATLDTSGMGAFHDSLAEEKHFVLPTTISMNMISGSASSAEPLDFKKAIAPELFESAIEEGDDASPFGGQCKNEFPGQDSALQYALGSMQEVSRQAQSLQKIGAQCKLTLDQYLSTRPPLFYGDGSRADLEERAYMSQFMHDCWESLNSSVQSLKDYTGQSEEQLKGLMHKS